MLLERKTGWGGATRRFVLVKRSRYRNREHLPAKDMLACRCSAEGGWEHWAQTSEEKKWLSREFWSSVQTFGEEHVDLWKGSEYGELCFGRKSWKSGCFHSAGGQFRLWEGESCQSRWIRVRSRSLHQKGLFLIPLTDQLIRLLRHGSLTCEPSFSLAERWSLKRRYSSNSSEMSSTLSKTLREVKSWWKDCGELRMLQKGPLQARLTERSRQPEIPLPEGGKEVRR